MAEALKYRLKAKEVTAIQHVGPNTLNVVGKKGEQRAQPGDYVVITGETPQDREVVPAKDFHDRYERVGEDGNAVDVDAATPGDAYGVPHYDTIEDAQAAAQLHYAPVEGDGETKPMSSEPFQCTIGNSVHMYAIQPSGIVNQIPVAMQDSTVDPGFGLPAGAQEDRFPATLANQGASVRDDSGPKSPFQPGTASAESPNQTQGNTLNQPVMGEVAAQPGIEDGSLEGDEDHGGGADPKPRSKRGK